MPMEPLKPLSPSTLQLLSYVMDEVDYALAKHGSHNRSTAEWLLIIEAELAEAKMANIKQTDMEVGHELRQVAACAILALIQNHTYPKRDWRDSGKAVLVARELAAGDNPAIRVLTESGFTNGPL